MTKITTIEASPLSKVLTYKPNEVVGALGRLSVIFCFKKINSYNFKVGLNKK